jgi:RES domain-containing protein
MRRTAYRIVQTRYAATAFDGEGARLNGGRWNSVGTSVIYTASSLSLATLEMLVHTENISIIYGRYAVIPVTFDVSLIRRLDGEKLPALWNAPQPIADTQLLGDDWINSKSSAVLEVPSAVTENEINYLINPAHPDFPQISLCAAVKFKPDARLRSGVK